MEVSGWHKSILLIIFMALSLAFEVSASERDSSVVENFSIHYKVDSIKINPDYIDNRRQIARIKNYLKTSPRIDSITVFAYASPEGRLEYNQWLSAERAKAAKTFLLKHSPDSSKLNAGKIKISPLAENWEGLIKCVEEQYHLPNREKVLYILHDQRIHDQARKWRLKCLDKGVTWRYFVDNYMPGLRAATWTCVWAVPPPVITSLNNITDSLEVPDKGLPLPVIRKKRTFAAVKTNLLYDAATALNFSVEIPFNRNFSVLYEHICPWWLADSNQYCLQFLTYGGEFRWWFLPRIQGESRKYKQRDALVGHFLGLNCWGGKADIQAGRNFGCYQFDFISAGLTYGYSMPVSKHLNLEFSISAGYARIPYQHYNPSEDWSLLIKDKNNAGILHYFGPTKAEISLVMPIRATSRKEIRYE